MSLGRGMGSLIGLVGFYQVFKDIQDALKFGKVIKDKIIPSLIWLKYFEKLDVFAKILSVNEKKNFFM